MKARVTLLMRARTYSSTTLFLLAVEILSAGIDRLRLFLSRNILRTSLSHNKAFEVFAARHQCRRAAASHFCCPPRPRGTVPSIGQEPNYRSTPLQASPQGPTLITREKDEGGRARAGARHRGRHRFLCCPHRLHAWHR